MDNRFQKTVNFSYLALAALVYFIIFSGLMKFSSIFDWESKVKTIEFIIRGGSLLIAGLTFFILFKNPNVNLFMNEVASELFTKVTWPTSKETMTATGVVMVTVLIAGFLLGLLDYIWAFLLKAMI